MWRSSLVAATLIATLAAPAAAEEPEKPTFSPIVEKPAFQFTKCALWCWARDAVGPTTSSVVVALRRVPTAEVLKPTGLRLALQSGQDDDVRTLPGVFEERTSDATQDSITVDPKLSELPPGTYSGALIFDVSSGASPVAVPVGLDVRLGPELPLFVLIASVFAGALLGLILDQRPKAKFKKSADALRERIDSLPAEERDILLPLWTTVWDERADTSAPAKLAALEKGSVALVRCRDVQDDALQLPEAVALPGWIRRIGVAVSDVIQAVRSFAESYDDKLAVVASTADGFKTAAAVEKELADKEVRARAASQQHNEYLRFTTAVKQARAALAGVPAQPSQPVPDLDPPLHAVRAAFTALETAHGSPLDAVPETGAARAAGLAEAGGLMLSLLGRPVRSEVAEGAEAAQAGGARAFDIGAWFGGKLGPLAATGVAVVLLAVGFKVTYLDNMTFGAKLTDWLTLVFWGLAAWGARRTLTGLGQAPAPAG
jgi:hypothetical protein